MYFCDIKSNFIFIFIRAVSDAKIRMLKFAVKTQIEFLANFFDIKKIQSDLFVQKI